MHGFRILLPLVFASIHLGLPGAWAQDESPAAVTVPDAALRAVLEDSLGLAAGEPILATELAELTVLGAQHKGIVDLTGVEHATGLRRLGLWGNPISDLSPLTGLTGLDTLGLGENEISDLSPLAGLTGLIVLTLDRNEISDLSRLAGLTGLAALNLRDNEISDLSPLAGLTGLTWLDLRGNEISDLSPLAGLTGLTWLDLRGNEISDVSPLAGLTSLLMLDLAHNSVVDVSPLAGLTGLTAVYVDQDVDLTPWPGRPSYTVRMPPPYKYPKLVDLSRTVERYEAALEAGRVTNRVGGGPCLFADEFFVDFSDWDPSKPAPSFYVQVRVGKIEAVERVTVLLEDHGIRCGSFEEWDLPCYVDGGRVVGCVPLPLLVPLSELPGVDWIALVPPFESASSTLLEGVSWGAVKDRLK